MCKFNIYYNFNSNIHHLFVITIEAKNENQAIREFRQNTQHYNSNVVITDIKKVGA